MPSGILDDVGQKFWHRLGRTLKSMGIASPAWEALMLDASIHYSNMVRATVALQELDLDKADEPIHRRLSKLVLDSSAQLRRGLSLLGVTPTDRSKIAGASPVVSGGAKKARFFTPRIVPCNQETNRKDAL